MAFVYSFCDVGRTDAVSHFPHEWSAEAEGIHVSSICTLTDSADDCLSRNQNLVSLRSLAYDTLIRNFESGVSEMCYRILGNLLHQDRLVTDVAVCCKNVAHLHKMHLFAFHSKMNGAFASCQSSSKYNHCVLDLILFKIIVIDYNNIVPIYTWKLRHNRSRTNSKNQCVRLL